jgi:hypothetical protein
MQETSQQRRPFPVGKTGIYIDIPQVISSYIKWEYNTPDEVKQQQIENIARLLLTVGGLILFFSWFSRNM